MDAVAGNSSSGLTEAPSFNIGTINIGDRQRGRLKAPSVIDCEPNTEGISQAFEKLYSNEFQANLQNIQNPYGNNLTSKHILTIIKKIDFSNILKKSFYDIGQTL
jgi:GDP/UDP-N,N'-diacetylbacillosamine 2-epimerase (hydrolysing)